MEPEARRGFWPGLKPCQVLQKAVSEGLWAQTLCPTGARQSPSPKGGLFAPSDIEQLSWKDSMPLSLNKAGFILQYGMGVGNWFQR